MNTFPLEHQSSSSWERHVSRIYSGNESKSDHSAGELADPIEIEFFLSHDLDFHYNEEQRSVCRSAREIIEDRKRDISSLLSEESNSFCTFCQDAEKTIQESFLVENHPSSTQKGDGTTQDYSTEDTSKAKKAKIATALECNRKLLAVKEGSFFRDATSISMKKDPSDLLSKELSFKSLVEEYQSGLDALTQCIARTRESRSKVSKIKSLYIKQESSYCESKIFPNHTDDSSNEQMKFEVYDATNIRQFKNTDKVKDDDLFIGKNIYLFSGNCSRKHDSDSVSSMETKDSTVV
ncbi:predicted protein [Chaetoceros tenuissimus]|uniref:Uncharacterized protein n=1 Tax=Chaetoceros tenuissimus TaxID=426638 RepID=A0AAD3CN84_9STRA|nr:predicted protein [Chaetoceros tenuissimus]